MLNLRGTHCWVLQQQLFILLFQEGDELMKRTSSVLSTMAVLAIAVLVIVDQATAATLRYRLSGDWATVTDGAGPGWGPNPNNNGNPGVSLPGGSDDARINWGGNTVSVNSAVPTVNRVQIGVDESGIVEVNNGGVLTTAGSNGDLLAGNNNANATGTLNVKSGGVVNVGRILWSANNSSNGNINVDGGGQVNVASHLWWGVTGSSNVNISGTVTQTGGILGLGTSDASTAGGGTATVNILDGGLLALNNISGAAGLPSIQAGSVIDISGSGELTLPGDFVGLLNDYASASKIVGNGGSSALTIDLTKNTGFTTAYINAIPEPATLLLLGVSLGAILLGRRR
jgi:hypothetical protein